jgi:predicted kinase
MPALMLTGLPGTGKSTLAAALATEIGAHVLSKDVIREAAFGPEHVAYSGEQDELVHGWMLEAAGDVLRRRPGRWVIFDGRTYARDAERQVVWRQFPQCFVVRCVVREEVARERLRSPHTAKNRDWALYERVRDCYEPLKREHWTVDTGRPLAECVGSVITYLRAAPST